MKDYLKKAAMLTLAGTLAVGSMTGCSKKVDGTKTVATVNDEEIKLGTVNFMLRYQQAQTAQMYDMYFGGASNGIWDTVADEETGETYGQQTINEVLEQLEDMVILRQHASEYKVTVSDDEKTRIQEAAKGFMEANDEATISKLGVDQGMIEQALELSYYREKMYDPITKDVDTKVSDKEAAQTAITYVSVSDSNGEDGAQTADAKERAQQILDQVLATADADMDAIAKEVDENLSATNTHFTTNAKKDETDESAVPKEVQDAVKKLADGEVASKLVESDGTYYVVRLDAAFDQAATDDEKETIANDRKQEAYDEVTDKWREDSKITEQDKVLKVLELKDNDKYTFKQPEATEAPADSEGAAVEEGAADTQDQAAEGTNTEDQATDSAEENTSSESDTE